MSIGTIGAVSDFISISFMLKIKIPVVDRDP
jgi:hypothetical protein